MPIFIGGTEAAAIGLALAGETPDRPLTHDVMAELVELLHARVDRVDVTELRDGAFLAEMTVSGPGGDQRLDTRPSDAIALALRLDAPLYVSDDVLEAAGSVFELASDDATSDDTEVLDDDAIDAAVAVFRAELDDVDPASFDAEPALRVDRRRLTTSRAGATIRLSRSADESPDQIRALDGPLLDTLPPISVATDVATEHDAGASIERNRRLVDVLSPELTSNPMSRWTARFDERMRPLRARCSSTSAVSCFRMVIAA